MFKFTHTEPLEICLLQFRFSYSSTGSCGGFCLGVSTLASCEFLYLPVYVSNFGFTSFPSDLSSLDISKRSFFFLFFSLFSNLLIVFSLFSYLLVSHLHAGHSKLISNINVLTVGQTSLYSFFSLPLERLQDFTNLY